MSDAREDVTVRARMLLAIVSAAVLPLLLAAVAAVLLPSLLITAPDATGSAAAAILAIALTALTQLGPRGRAVVARTGSAGSPPADEGVPVLAGRVTDPVHHPLRPRAPGPA